MIKADLKNLLKCTHKSGKKKTQSCRQQTDNSTNINPRLHLSRDLPAFGAVRTNFTVAINFYTIRRFADSRKHASAQSFGHR